MRTISRPAALIFPVLLACAQLAAEGTAGTIDYRHGYAFLAEPKYPPDFPHFDYVNPNAPKGGMLRRHGTGSWDSFNPAALRAAQVVAGLSTAAPHANFLNDSLLAEAADEPSTWYGRLASGIAIAPDGAWIAFRIRDHARWHDGRPLTVEDVAYTFKVYREDATSTISTPLEPIEAVEIIGEWEIRFRIREDARGDPLLPIQIGQVPIIPKHYWESRDISRTTVEPPLGSGPYRVGEFQVGRWIRWERVEDYWGQDLPVMRGRFNFDVLKYDYFADDRLKTEAVKGDVIDFHVENVPGYWERDYDTPAFKAGVFRREWLPVKQPWGLWWPVFWNLDQPRFQDVRVREALWLVSDFVWLNRTNYDFYGLATSYFHGSGLAARDLPSERELALLEPVREHVPPRVFTEPYQAPPNGGGGWHRENLIRAAELLREAGWVVRDDELVHGETGEPFHIRFVAVSPALGRSFIPYTRNLKRLGITSQHQVAGNLQLAVSAAFRRLRRRRALVSPELHADALDLPELSQRDGGSGLQPELAQHARPGGGSPDRAADGSGELRRLHRRHPRPRPRAAVELLLRSRHDQDPHWSGVLGPLWPPGTPRHTQARGFLGHVVVRRGPRRQGGELSGDGLDGTPSREHLWRQGPSLEGGASL